MLQCSSHFCPLRDFHSARFFEAIGLGYCCCTNQGSQFSVDPLKSVDFAFSEVSGRSLLWVHGHLISPDDFFSSINQSDACRVSQYLHLI